MKGRDGARSSPAGNPGSVSADAGVAGADASRRAEAVCRAGPSLALLKYWGKVPGGTNLPATPSLAITLAGAYSETQVATAVEDSVSVDGVQQEQARYGPFFDGLRDALGVRAHFRATSVNSFPGAAGLASSSSGFAALAGACARAAGCHPSPEELSAMARVGSASAARAVFGGFVLMPAGARSARPIFDPGHWPDLRVVAVVTHDGPKPVPSRRAMEGTRLSSPYYGAWVEHAATLLPEALHALEQRDLERLGEAARRSYSLMHGAILGAEPPLLYWLPETVHAIRACAEMRAQGIGAWETVDAGPQVKILCLETDAAKVSARIAAILPTAKIIACAPGPGLQFPAE
jgi:diphosphomevalonate decarboxylase